MHRYYTEYLQKELDFLKILVVRFHGQDNIPAIEMDMALQKTQDIYEQLLRMKLMKEVPEEKKEQYNQVADILSTVRKTETPLRETETSPLKPSHEEIVKEEVIKEGPVTGTEVEPGSEVEPEVIQISLEVEKEVVTTVVGTQPAESGIVVEKQISEKEVILAEKIRPAGLNPINETLAKKNMADLSSRLQSKPLSSMASGIGLNDRFLYTRELFQGNVDLYNQTIRELDKAKSYDDAISFVDSHFNWNKDEETTQKFIGLITRRHKT